MARLARPSAHVGEAEAFFEVCVPAPALDIVAGIEPGSAIVEVRIIVARAGAARGPEELHLLRGRSAEEVRSPGSVTASCDAPTDLRLLVSARQQAEHAAHRTVVQPRRGAPPKYFETIQGFQRHEAQVEGSGVRAADGNLPEHHRNLIAGHATKTKTKRCADTSFGNDPRTCRLLQELVGRLRDETIPNDDLTSRRGRIQGVCRGNRASHLRRFAKLGKCWDTRQRSSGADGDQAQGTTDLPSPSLGAHLLVLIQFPFPIRERSIERNRNPDARLSPSPRRQAQQYVRRFPGS